MRVRMRACKSVCVCVCVHACLSACHCYCHSTTIAAEDDNDVDQRANGGVVWEVEDDSNHAEQRHISTLTTKRGSVRESGGTGGGDISRVVRAGRLLLLSAQPKWAHSAYFYSVNLFLSCSNFSHPDTFPKSSI